MLAIIVICSSLQGFGGLLCDEIRLVEFGPDHARGVLVNASCGRRPSDPLDPGKTTILIVHGLNPFHPFAHFSVGPRYAEALRLRYGALYNVAYWDWNAATGNGLHESKERCLAVSQGYRLADQLVAQNIEPSRLHLIGQSAGCMLVAATAQRLAHRTGTPVGCVTVIDPARLEHGLIFEQLRVGLNAHIVEHLWVPGFSGFGAQANYPNVRNITLQGPRGWRGLVRVTKSDHLHAVRWHIAALTR
jgi:pimeloyl-ACP methyl ester carboxylesterase